MGRHVHLVGCGIPWLLRATLYKAKDTLHEGDGEVVVSVKMGVTSSIRYEVCLLFFSFLLVCQGLLVLVGIIHALHCTSYVKEVEENVCISESQNEKHLVPCMDSKQGQMKDENKDGKEGSLAERR